MCSAKYGKLTWQKRVFLGYWVFFTKRKISLFCKLLIIKTLCTKFPINGISLVLKNRFACLYTNFPINVISLIVFLIKKNICFLHIFCCNSKSSRIWWWLWWEQTEILLVCVRIIPDFFLPPFEQSKIIVVSTLLPSFFLSFPFPATMQQYGILHRERERPNKALNEFSFP